MNTDLIAPFSNTQKEKVEKLLLKISSSKAVRAGTEEALGYAKEAYELSHSERFPIPQPWPAVVAYRKALLMLRAGILTSDDLVEIDDLLCEAGKQDALGPWPRVYRLPVLTRLNCPKNKLEDAIGWALESSNKHKDFSGRFQSSVFNAIEMGSFFMGCDYSPLEGYGLTLDGMDSIFSPLQIGKSVWKVWGDSDLDFGVFVPYRIADCEIKNRIEQEKRPYIAFKSEYNGKYEYFVKSRDSSGWQPISRDRYRYLLAFYFCFLSKRGSNDCEVTCSSYAIERSRKELTGSAVRKFKERVIEKLVSSINLKEYKFLSDLFNDFKVYVMLSQHDYQEITDENLEL